MLVRSVGSLLEVANVGGSSLEFLLQLDPVFVSLLDVPIEELSLTAQVLNNHRVVLYH